MSVICSELTGCRHPVTVTGWAPKEDGPHIPGTHTDCLLDVGSLKEWGPPGSYIFHIPYMEPDLASHRFLKESPELEL